MVYLKDEKGNYWNDDYHYLVGPLTKDQAEPMTETHAKAIIAKNSKWEMEDANE